MKINEKIITGKKFRVCVDVINKLWERFSFWTKACDVEFDDGKTAEEKLGKINGITSDPNCEDESIAVSAKAFKDLNAKTTVLTDTPVKIGTYNGLPLYRVVYEHTMGASVSQTNYVQEFKLDLPISKIITISSVAASKDGSYYYQVPYAQADHWARFVVINNVLRFVSSEVWTNNKLTITIDYCATS